MDGNQVDIRCADWDDSTFAHASAISFGLKWLLAANGTLLVRGDNDSHTCLAQGVLPGVTQATAALLGEQDIVRMVLHEHGIPTPDTQVRHLGEGVDNIVGAAEAWGFPLTIRPVAVSTTTPAPLRAVSVSDRAAAGEEVLRVYHRAGRRAGRPALPQGRLMLERPAGSTDLHVLVVDRGVAAVTASAPTASGSRSYWSVETEAARQALLPTVSSIVDAFPDLSAAAVHLSVEDGWPATLGQHSVTALEIYPRLALHEQGEPGAGLTLATAVLQRALRRQLRSEDALATCVCHMQIVGLPDSQEVLRTLGGSLTEHGLQGTIRPTAADGAAVTAEVRGTPARLASFTRALFHSGDGAPRPLYVESN